MGASREAPCRLEALRTRLRPRRQAPPGACRRGLSRAEETNMAFQVQIMTSDGEWVQAGPASIATREEAEREREYQVEMGADVDRLDVDRLPMHNGSRLIELA